MDCIRVSTRDDAWVVAKLKFPTMFEYSSEDSERAGYPIYVSAYDDYPNCHISDLGCRLELNLGCETMNIWIDSGTENVKNILLSMEKEFKDSYLSEFNKDCKSCETIVAKAKHDVIISLMDKFCIDYK